MTRKTTSQTNQKLPKGRLAPKEAKLLQMFKDHHILSKETALSTADAYKKYIQLWPRDGLTIATASTALQALRDCQFFDYSRGRPVMVDKPTKQYAQTKKMRNWLSNKVQKDEIFIDDNRWLVLNGEYIADEITRQRVEDREQRKRDRLQK